MTQHLNFEDDLRRALAPRAAQAPLPPDALQVPAGWVGARRSAVSLVGRALAFAVVGTAAAVLAVQLSGALDLGAAQQSRQSIAEMMAVPERQVLQTQDGFLTVRLSPSQLETVELLLVRPGQEPELLATGAMYPYALAPSIISLSTFPLSCEASVDLAQPNIVFGYAGLASASVDRVTLDLPAQGTFNDGLFVFVLGPGAASATTGALTVASSETTEVGGTSLITPGQFRNGDACQGESVPALK